MTKWVVHSLCEQGDAYWPWENDLKPTGLQPGIVTRPDNPSFQYYYGHFNKELTTAEVTSCEPCQLAAAKKRLDEENAKNEAYEGDLSDSAPATKKA